MARCISKKLHLGPAAAAGFVAVRAGAGGQRATARALEEACSAVGCSFIVNTGDNFYECVSAAMCQCGNPPARHVLV